MYNENMVEITLEYVLNTVWQLPLSEQKTLLERVRERHVELLRQEIAQDHAEAMRSYRAGELRSQTADELDPS